MLGDISELEPVLVMSEVAERLGEADRFLLKGVEKMEGPLEVEVLLEDEELDRV